MDTGTLDRLAELVVKFGANVQPKQQVVIATEVGKEDADACRRRARLPRGALHVSVEYGDPWIKRARIEHGIDAALGYGPDWVRVAGARAGRFPRRRDRSGGTGRTGRAGGARQRPAGPRPPSGGQGGNPQPDRVADQLDGRAVPDLRVGGAGLPRQRPRGGARQAVGAGGAHLPPGHRGSGGGLELAVRGSGQGQACARPPAGSMRSTCRRRAPT